MTKYDINVYAGSVMRELAFLTIRLDLDGCRWPKEETSVLAPKAVLQWLSQSWRALHDNTGDLDRQLRASWPRAIPHGLHYMLQWSKFDSSLVAVDDECWIMRSECGSWMRVSFNRRTFGVNFDQFILVLRRLGEVAAKAPIYDAEHHGLFKAWLDVSGMTIEPWLCSNPDLPMLTPLPDNPGPNGRLWDPSL